jgi:hypothetical protein
MPWHSMRFVSQVIYETPDVCAQFVPEGQIKPSSSLGPTRNALFPMFTQCSNNLGESSVSPSPNLVKYIHTAH